MIKASTIKRLAACALGVVVVVALAACGSSSSSSSSSSSTSSGASGSSAESAKYAALLKSSTALTPSQYAGPTQPAPAPPGVKIGVISCSQSLEGCVLIAKGITKAASEIGWTPRTFDGKAEATTQNAQILNAISWGAKVIVLLAIDPSTVQTGLSAAKKAGVVISAASNGLSSPNPTVNPPSGDIWPAFDVSPDYKQAGEYEANWIIADSGGKANTVVYGDKEYLSVVAQQPGVIDTLKSCSGCTTAPVIYFTANQIATSLGPEVVSYLRTHPDVNYIFCPYDPAAPAMVTAIQSAGLASKVKIVSLLGDEQNLKFIKEGQVQAADGANDQQYMGYAVVDQTIRILDHKPMFQPLGENVPYQLLTKENLPASLESWQAPFDYVSKYTALWKAG